MKNLTSLVSFASLASLVSLASMASMAVGCAASTAPTGGERGSDTTPITQGSTQPAPAPAPSPSPSPAPACAPIAQSSGSANPASVYCAAMGYALAGDQCAFSDGTSCEQWAFYRGECGAQHSFCNLHGGVVSNKVENMGTWTASYAICNLPTGKQCHEDTFARTCACE